MKLQPYPKYKPSGVEWLGDVPADWDVNRVKWSVLACINGTWGDEPTGDGDIICVRVADFDRDNYRVVEEPPTLRSVDTNQLKTRALKKGDLLIEKSGGGEKQLVGCVVFFDHNYRAICSNFVARMPVARGMNARFWSYVHAALYRGKLNYPAIKQTTGIQNLDASCYLDTPAAFPSLGEQKKIASVLDRETGRIDQLVGKKRELIERLREKRTALISRTVTRGLPPSAALAAGLPANPPLKHSGIDWLGEIPEHWEVKKLSWLFRYAKGPNAATLTKEYVADNGGDYPVFSGQTENNGLMGMIDWYEFDCTSPVIFVTTVGARAMTTRLVSGRFSLSQNCALIIPRSGNANPYFFEPVLRCLFDYERRSISLIMQPSLRFDDLDKFRVPLPPPKEQIAIADYLNAEIAKMDALLAKVEEAIERLQEYRTALITAAVTGKIDVREEVAL